MPLKPFILDEEHGIDLKARRIGGEKAPVGVDLSLREFFRQARMGNRNKASQPARPLPEHLQRCAVQVRYTKGGSVGKWYSHGAYIARESRDGNGFDASSEKVPVAQTMADWRRAEDKLFFRMIISPEFGERLDLKKLTRETVDQMERDLQTKLEWIAVEHYNTDRPHVHLVVRGKRDSGRDLRIPPQYVKEGLRDRASESATRQLGYRTHEDVLEAQRREIHQVRFTGLDRRIQKRVAPDGVITLGPNLDATEHHLDRRLHHLETMGLAESRGYLRWWLHPEIERTLRAAQKTRDRVQIMESHGIMASDTNLPFRMLKLTDLHDVEGRVLVHGQDEYSGNNFSLVETVQGEMVRVPHAKEIAHARQYGNLQPGSYVRIQRISDDKVEIKEYGDADAVLVDQAFMRENAERLARVVPAGLNGWLGKIHNAAIQQQSRNIGIGR